LATIALEIPSPSKSLRLILMTMTGGAAERPTFPAPFANYELGAPYDEMFHASGLSREHYREIYDFLQQLPAEELRLHKQAADQTFLHQGITFTVYGRDEGTERIIPHDLLPRIITAQEWGKVEAGLEQRIHALNLFLRDIYHEGRILADGVVPREIIYSCKHFRREMRGVHVPKGNYLTVVGTDLIRLPDGEFVVLEDNLRVPSGVSYMLTSRQVLKRIFPKLYQACGVRPIDQPTVVLLSPGCTTALILSTRFWRGRWGFSWWKAGTWWFTTTLFICGRRRVCGGWM